MYSRTSVLISSDFINHYAESPQFIIPVLQYYMCKQCKQYKGWKHFKHCNQSKYSVNNVNSLYGVATSISYDILFICRQKN